MLGSASELTIAYGRDTLTTGMLGLSADQFETYMHYCQPPVRPDRPAADLSGRRPPGRDRRRGPIREQQ